MQYDAIVIGGGITGASICYWLKKKSPAMKVVLLEQQHLAYGATGRNAGLVTCGSVVFFAKLLETFGEEKGFEIWRFCEQNHSLLREHILNHAAASTYYHRDGSLTAFSKPSSAEKHKKTAQKMASLGLPIEWINEEQIAKWNLQRFVGGALYKGDGSVNASLLTRRIFDLSGADLISGFHVNSLESRNGKVYARSDREEISATTAYSGLNPFTSKLLPQTKGRVRPVRAQIFETTAVAPFLPFNVYASDELAYFRQTHKNTILMGGQRGVDEAAEETDREDVNPKIQSSLEMLLKKIITTPWSIDRSWAGIMGFTESQLPEIGVIDANILYLAGYSGHGMGMGFHSSKALVEWRLDGRPLPAFLNTFSN